MPAMVGLQPIADGLEPITEWLTADHRMAYSQPLNAKDGH